MSGQPPGARFASVPPTPETRSSGFRSSREMIKLKIAGIVSVKVPLFIAFGAILHDWWQLAKDQWVIDIVIIGPLLGWIDPEIKVSHLQVFSLSALMMSLPSLMFLEIFLYNVFSNFGRRFKEGDMYVISFAATCLMYVGLLVIEYRSYMARVAAITKPSVFTIMGTHVAASAEDMAIASIVIIFSTIWLGLFLARSIIELENERSHS